MFGSMEARVAAAAWFIEDSAARGTSAGSGVAGWFVLMVRSLRWWRWAVRQTMVYLQISL
ncbi:hypothetical protein DQ353_16690 [Arthrobacter sp. AQ5-05]|nr:hypothetical protein DQ353_16690 [Arthrobacter sp. AQ5-05]